MAHVRERPPLRESTEIVTPSGKRYRWAQDETQPENVPRDERWSDVMSGGFETFDATLPRKPAVDYADLERLSRVTRYDASGGVIWQGRLERAPRVSGDQIAVSPSAVGYQAHLEDDKSVCEVFIDRDLGAWRGPDTTYRAALSGWAQGDAGLLADPVSGAPRLALTYTGAWATPNGLNTNSFYEAPPQTALGRFYGEWSTNANVGSGGGAWILTVYTSDDGNSSFPENGGDALTGAASSGTYDFSPTTARRFFAISWAYTATPAGTDGMPFDVYIANLCVFGDHGLTVRGVEFAGTGPDYEDRTWQGFYDGDVIGYALSRWCPAITYTDETLVADTFIIPQLAFKEPTTVGEIIKQATRFHLRDWAVWEGPTFWLHDRGARGSRWRARVGPTQLEETGPQVDRLWNSIIVQYQDVDGSTRTAGPPGSGADTESADLVDDDPENPATKAGITRRDVLVISGVSTWEGAITAGYFFLQETKRLDSSGRARVVGHVQDDKGVWHPYSHVRAGDYISFTDAADTSYRRIVKTDKSRSDRSCSVDLDAPPEAMQVLLERWNAILVPLGV